MYIVYLSHPIPYTTFYQDSVHPNLIPPMLYQSFFIRIQTALGFSCLSHMWHLLGVRKWSKENDDRKEPFGCCRYIHAVYWLGSDHEPENLRRIWDFGMWWSRPMVNQLMCLRIPGDVPEESISWKSAGRLLPFHTHIHILFFLLILICAINVFSIL